MTTVALVGFSPRTKQYAHDLPAETEIWSLNWAWKHALPRIDRLFEIHDDAYLAQANAASRQHLDWLKGEHQFPIYMLPEARAEVPSSERYPFEEIVEEFMGGLLRGEQVQRVFTSTFDYMMAMAIYEGVERIELLGIEMESQTEYAYQRPGMAFWMGIALGRGIEVWQHAESQLFRPRVYHEGGQMIGRQTIEAHKNSHELAQQQLLGSYNATLGRFDVLREKHAEDKASDDELGEARQAVLDAKAHLDIVSGAMQAVELLLREFDSEDNEILLENQVAQVPLGSDQIVVQAEEAA